MNLTYFFIPWFFFFNSKTSPHGLFLELTCSKSKPSSLDSVCLIRDIWKYNNYCFRWSQLPWFYNLYSNSLDTCLDHDFKLVLLHTHIAIWVQFHKTTWRGIHAVIIIHNHQLMFVSLWRWASASIKVKARIASKTCIPFRTCKI